MANKRQTPARKARRATRPGRKGFVGRDASPVLDRYPPKDPNLSPRGPPGGSNAAAASAPTPTAASRPSAATSPSSAPAVAPLISLERPFDVDEFAGLLGETSIRVTVPLEHLAEVLRRVTDFMGFGIYVYALTVRPAPSELLKSFVVELRRVDYSASDNAWVPFVEKGTSDSPFGPSGNRT
jgi:hypothetical protein